MLLLLSFAFADSVTLDNGVVLEVDLARYEVHGDCQMSVLEGDLQGAILIVPCHRVQSFQRTAEALVLPAQAVVEAEVEEEVEEEAIGEFAPTEFVLEEAPLPPAPPELPAEPRPTSPGAAGRPISF